MALLDLVAQQLVLQESLGNYPDLNLLEVNLRNCIKRYLSKLNCFLHFISLKLQVLPILVFSQILRSTWRRKRFPDSIQS